MTSTRERFHAMRRIRETQEYRDVQAIVDRASQALKAEEASLDDAEQVVVQYLYTTLARLEEGGRIPRLLLEDTCEAVTRERAADEAVAQADAVLSGAIEEREDLMERRMS